MNDDTTAPPCPVCARALREDERGTCKACVGAVRADLHAILNAYALLPDMLDNLGSNAPRRDPGGGRERPLPGGDPLVMLGAGGDARAAWLRWRRAEETGLEHDEPPFGIDDNPGDPMSVAYVLGAAEDDWRRVRHEPAANGPAYVTTASSYLLRNLPWAAGHHDAFADFAADMRTLRRQLESVTRTDDRPERAGVTCFEAVRPLPIARCGGQLVREWRPPQGGNRPGNLGRDTEGRADDATCLSCGRIYSGPAYWLAVRSSLERKTGDAGEAS